MKLNFGSLYDTPVPVQNGNLAMENHQNGNFAMENHNPTDSGIEAIELIENETQQPNDLNISKQPQSP